MLGVAEQIKELYKEYAKLQGRIFILLGKQINSGEVCDCERPEPIRLPVEDDEVRRYCVQCGGEIMEEK